MWGKYTGGQVTSELTVEGEERLAVGQSGQLFITMSAAWGILALGQQALPPLLPSIISGLEITPFLAGIALSVMWGGLAIFQYLGGRIANELSIKTALLAGIGILVGGFFLLSLTVSYPIFLFAMALLGIGGGVYLIAMRVAIAMLFVERRGQAFGINLAVGMGGNILAAGAATLIIAVTIWQALYLPLAVIIFGIGVLLHLWIPQSYRFARVPLQLSTTIARVFETRKMRVLVLVYGLYAIAWQGLIGFFPTYLQVVNSLPAVQANTAFAAIFLIGMVMSPVAGRLSDLYSRPLMGSISLIVTGVGVVILVLTSSVPGVVGAIVLLGIGLHGFPATMQAYLMDSFPDRSLGSDFGAFRTAYTGIGSIGPAFVGYLSEIANFPTAFTGIATCLSISLVLLYVTLLR